MMQSAVRHEEHLTMAELAIDDSCHVDPGLANEIAAEFDAKCRIPKHIGKILEALSQALADEGDVDRLVAREVGNAEASAQIAVRKRRAAFLGETACEFERLCLGFGNRLCIERLAAGEDVKTAPLCSARHDRANQRRHTLGIDAEGLGAATHFHAGALEIEIRVHADGETRNDTKTNGKTSCRE